MHNHTLSINTPPSGTLHLERAILLYRESGTKAMHATINRVASTPTGPVILPGRAAQVRASQFLARALLRGEAHGFIPLELLYRDERQMVWWVPPGMRRVLFRCEALGGERAEVVPHPGLVFRAVGQEWWVHAVAGNERPSPSTPLFRAPYFNVWKEGKICTGNVELPTGSNSERIEAWNRAFFNSFFTHPNDRKKLVRYVGGPVKFWRAMLNGRFGDTFPLTVLIPTTATVASLIPKENHA